ncbi:hypothetical protein G7043_39975 [Lentzea sp. NEAU-D13]|uniref:DUF6292 domain-containing protein n=1 Tax=Lentzea alba TaxID=2714351 RepID=A0A7C9RWJ7_9PSEU|nr:DUF6292 family protein [Lentzea alba]NGY65105.1 hypothetical protein [Lentzea alba]
MTTWVADRADHTAWYAEHSLRRYVEAVALAVGQPADGVASELADTATGYIALTARSPAFPDRDLMLTWSGNSGWALATEPASPAQQPRVLARLTAEVRPSPSQVARFVTRTLTAERHGNVPRPERGERP